MFKLLKVMAFSALVLFSACSEKKDNTTEKLIIQSGEKQYEYDV